MLTTPPSRFLACLAASGLLMLIAPSSVTRAQAECGSASNPVACENGKAGAPASEWDVGAGDPTIQGFATEMSVNQGDRIGFKIATVATSYQIEIYRIGYYGGLGARRIASVSPSVTLPQAQPECVSEPTTGLIDCGNWEESAFWDVPSDVTSGIYVAKLTRPDTGGGNHIYFVVRSDAGRSGILFQTSDTTWQAYNSYGGNSLYTGAPVGRAYKVSYNRPFNNRTNNIKNQPFYAEYPMVRWLEANGYNVSYSSGLDTDRLGTELLEHKVFLSAGHDEYWSGAQRTNVEAARAAGVNLAFVTGNDMYWKTRWEPSIDGTATPYRTLVSYKETHANLKIDPDAAWTGTWRDPRFSPPSDGGRPENALTGTIYTVDCCSYAIQVRAEHGALRFWRNTSIAALAPGEVATLAPQTLGYEWNEDLDNGHRPTGLFQLSSTTVSVPNRLRDFGTVTGPGVATHSLTLYRHGSGALVFSAGTVQWSWGLDPKHDSAPAGATGDLRMQQATLNLLADMGEQPATPQAGLFPADQSVDTTSPVTAITSPIDGSDIPPNGAVEIAGTATDADGRVSAVEISVDGGVTWRRATGRESWTYAWTPVGTGPVVIKSRGIDDSGTLEVAGGETNVYVTDPQCPCSIWNPATAVPAVINVNDSSELELGVKFRAGLAGFITGLRFYKSVANVGPHTANLWTTSGTLLATATFSGETASGWQQVLFPVPVAVAANGTYVASYHTTRGHYSVTSNYFRTSGVDTPPLHALGGTTQANGVYSYGPSAFPTLSYNATNYWVDVVFDTTLPPDSTPPTITTTTPAAGATSVNAATALSVTFSEPVNPSTVSTSTFELQTAGGSSVAATVSYDAPTRRATLTPLAPLSDGATYTARVRGGTTDPRVKDVAGNPLASDVTWSFTTIATVGCPCSIWNATTSVPAVVDSDDPGSVELGVKFRADVDGVITGVRFYKSLANTGPHVGNLWTATGSLLASATFSDESASGWQEVSFGSPVAITANTLYVVSYHTSAGHYSVSSGYFATAGADAPPLHAVGNSTNANGVYRYGASGFPNFTYNAGNYWVDVVFNTGAPVTDTTPPTVTIVTPAAGATGTSVTSTVSATFSEPMDPATILSATMELTDASAALVAGAVSYNPASRVATLTPNTPLADGATYTLRIRGGTTDPRAKDVAGNALAADVVSSFTTRLAGGCPCSIWDPSSAIPAVVDSGDSSAVELGVKFRADVDGMITGVRFYKSAANTGAHRANLWTTSGALLATAMFTNETGSGWQEVEFSSPVPVTANTVYVASYHTAAGRYSVNSNYFNTGVDSPPLRALSNSSGGNGVFRYGLSGFPTSTYDAGNYWVDVVFTAAAAGPDTTPPTVTAVTPAAGATSVGPASSVTVTFSEPVDASTVNTATFELRDASTALVAATVSYHAPTRTATLAPTTTLAQNATYTARVRGGTTDPRVADPSGNALAADMTWSFTTTAPASCPCSIWNPATAVPAIADSGDANAVELGVKFRADVDGLITGLRFYKSAANTGSHRGNLWTAEGALLATAIFTNETGSGWQQVSFATPVTVVANTVYVASYHTSAGRYALSSGYFASAGTDTPPLHALGNGASTNGVFQYGPGGFPSSSWNATNYWVDVVFMPGTEPITTFVQTTPADFSTGVLGSGGYVGVTGNGELMLAPTIGEEFAGASLPAGWSATGWSGSSSTTVTAGVLAVDGTRVSTNALFAAGRSLDFVATFSGASYQHAGFGVTLQDGVWAMFSSGDGQALYVRTSDGANSTNTAIPGSWFGTPHRFRIDWSPSGIAYFIDGVPVASHATAISASMRPLASDYFTDGSVLRVDWVRLGPYASSAEYVSATLDAGATVAWESAEWTGTAPSATSVIVSVRSGDTPAPDDTWTSFAVVKGPLGASSRYLQYRLQLSTTDAAQTPVVNDVTVRFTR